MIYGLELLISKNIGYYNIKPENIFCFEENIKLIDYGLFFIYNKILNRYMSPELLIIFRKYGFG